MPTCPSTSRQAPCSKCWRHALGSSHKSHTSRTRRITPETSANDTSIGITSASDGATNSIEALGQYGDAHLVAVHLRIMPSTNPELHPLFSGIEHASIE